MAGRRLKANDTVMVMKGKDKGKTGKVVRFTKDGSRVFVEGVNMVKKAVKQQRQNEQGGIIEVEASIDVSNVMPVSKGQPTRVGFTVNSDGKKTRTARKTGEVL
ncbi:MAG: 50S ribosomal protein L24 [Spirochaetales bacterium]